MRCTETWVMFRRRCSGCLRWARVPASSPLVSSPARSPAGAGQERDPAGVRAPQAVTGQALAPGFPDPSPVLFSLILVPAVSLSGHLD